MLLALQEKTVAITDSFNPKPITGRHSIFQSVPTKTEQRMDVEIVGVFTDLETAGQARAAHAAAHKGRRYLQKVCQLDEGINLAPPETPKCIKCRAVDAQPGQSFCPRCQAAHLRECIELDPLGGEGDRVPIVKTNYGVNSTILNQGAA